MKAQQIQAQFDAQNTHTVRRHSHRRGMLTAVAAAAALMIGGTMTVGAVNHWDYSAVFSKYFAEKSGEQVSYDFTGMGLDIGEKIEGDGFTMTVQSVLADASNVYIAYDVELSDEFNAIFAAYDDAELFVNMASLIEIPGDEEGRNNEFLNRGGASPRPVCDEEGVWHCMEVIAMDFGTGLDGTWLRLVPIDERSLLCIGYGYSEEGKGQRMELSAPGFELCYDLSGITVQPGMTAHYGGTLPNDANENIFDDLIVTPFMLKFVASGHIGVFDTEPKWGMVWGDERVPVSFTAVYADGTERALIQNTGAGSGGGMSCRNPDGGYDWEIRREYYIATPFTLDGLTAIRVNGTEIPMN